MNKRNILTIAGFLIFFFGFLALILQLFAGGLRLTFLSFLDSWGATPAFVIKLSMIFVGMVIFYVSRTESGIE
jgi:hypothetical protein